MKKLALIAPILLLAGLQSVAQSAYYPDNNNVDMLRHAGLAPILTRQEFILPEKVNGLTPLRTDLHIHTYYSDGHCSPQFRVKEAWIDGLDAIAISDHIEYRPNDKAMADYLGIGEKDAGNLRSDLNKSTRLARKAAKEYGLVVIPATEITREPVEIGHYNALFTTDNNAIPDPDPLVAIRNAKKQNALVMHNHPGWRRKSIAHPEFEKQAYAEDLIDGIEIMNGCEFYPGAVDRAREHGLFVASSTDIHYTTGQDYKARGHQRDMTIVFAEDNSLASIRKALENRQSVAYSFGTIAGDEQLLKDLFAASVRTATVGDQLMLTNTTSLPFVIDIPGQNQLVLSPLSTIKIGSREGKQPGKALQFTVTNMWCGADCHPQITIP